MNLDPQQQPPVVFLDVDGVLVPFPGPETFAPAALAALAAIVRGAQARIVLSSTWRADPRALDLILERFRSFGPPLSTAAFATTDPTVHQPRQWEIARWLDRHRPERWIAIDDEDLVNGPENARHRGIFQDHALRIDSTQGLTADHVQPALAILQHRSTNTAHRGKSS